MYFTGFLFFIKQNERLLNHNSSFTGQFRYRYSPDLAPSDYYLFSKLKKDLRGRKFDDDEEVKSAVMDNLQIKIQSTF